MCVVQWYVLNVDDASQHFGVFLRRWVTVQDLRRAGRGHYVVT